MVRILLTSRYAMWMGWGPDLTFFYNDAYARMTLGAKASLGARPAGARSVGRDLARLEPAHRDRAAHRRGHVGRRAAAVSRAQRLPGGDLPHLLLQPAARRRRRDRRHALRRHRGDRAASSASGGWRRCGSSRPRLAAIRTEPMSARSIQRGARRRTTYDLPFSLIYLFDASRQRARLACRDRHRRRRTRRRRPMIDRTPPSAVAARRSLEARRSDVDRSVVAPSRPADGRLGRPPRAALVPCQSPAGPGPAGRFPRRRRQSLPAVRRRLRRLPRPGRRHRSPPASPTRGPTRRSASAPRRWPRSTAPRPRSSPTSATSSARR